MLPAMISIPVKIINRADRPIILIEGSIGVPIVPVLRVEGFVVEPWYGLGWKIFQRRESDPRA
jgi:hypothetical protein